jgi:hypothetical protein
MHISIHTEQYRKNCIISHAKNRECASAQMQRLLVTDKGSSPLRSANHCQGQLHTPQSQPVGVSCTMGLTTLRHKKLSVECDRKSCLSWLLSSSVHQILLTDRVFSQCINWATATELSQTDPQYTTHAFQQHKYKHWCTSCHSVYFYPFHWQCCRCSSWLWPLVTRSTCARVRVCAVQTYLPLSNNHYLPFLILQEYC